MVNVQPRANFLFIYSAILEQFGLVNSAVLPLPIKSVNIRSWLTRLYPLCGPRRDWLAMALSHVLVACLALWAGLGCGPEAYISRGQHAVAMTMAMIDRMSECLCT